MSRLSILIVLAVLLTAVGVVTVPGQSAPQLVTVRVGAVGGTSRGPLFIADKEGFFARQGIRFEWVVFSEFGPASGPLIQGQIDAFAGQASAAFFNAVAAGQRIHIVASLGYYDPTERTSALVIRKDLGTSVKRLADLRGRTIGVNSLLGSSQYVLTKMLARDGLKISDVQLIRIPFPSIAAALLNRAIDAAFLSQPWLALVESQGSGVPIMYAAEVMTGEDTGSVVTYGPRLLERERELGQRFMVALLQGVRQFSRGPTDRNVSIIAEYLKVDVAAVREAGWSSMYPDGRVNINSIRRFQDWLYEIRQIEVRNPATQLVDQSFAEQATRTLARP